VPAVLIYGITAVGAQIVLIRELLASFYGNELTVGIVLSVWLLANATGSASAERKNVQGRFFLPGVQVLIACMAPLSLVLTRWVRGVVGMQGQVFAPWQVLVLTLLVIGPICFLLGACFTALLRRFGEKRDGAEAVSRVYYLECLGAAAGGILLSYILLPLGIEAFPIMTGLLTLGLFAAWTTLSRRPGNLTALFVLASLALTVTASTSLDKTSSRMRWKPFELIEARNSRYGLLSAVRSKGEVSVFESGLFSFSQASGFLPELTAHIPMLNHDNPRDILVLGGGLFGMIAELEKYEQVRSITYVELNDELVSLARDLELFEPSEHAKLRVVHDDPRMFLADTGDRYDIVISAAPGPVTAQFNRFYSYEFFRDVMEILKHGGIFATSAASSENFLNPSQARLLSSLRTTLEEVFPEVLITPGSVAVMIGLAEALSRDAGVLVSRLQSRELKTSFVTSGFIHHLLEPARVDYITHALNQHEGMLNTDIHPKCYLYGLFLQQSRVASGQGSFVQRFYHNAIPIIITVLLAMALGPVCVRFVLTRSAPVADGLLYGIGALTGFIQMSAAITIIFRSSPSEDMCTTSCPSW